MRFLSTKSEDGKWAAWFEVTNKGKIIIVTYQDQTTAKTHMVVYGRID